jgi:hypothetical protein
MPGPDRPRPDQIRALIEEVDRLCRETETVTNQIDQSLKRDAFWPDRRKKSRHASTESDRDTHREG